jgi:multisubunit Na+/H+ antiporter MnhE subunit
MRPVPAFHIPRFILLVYAQTMRRMIGQFVLLLVFYLLLVGKVTWPEGIVGCVVAAIAVTARESACRCGGATHVFAAGWGRRYIRLPGQVVSDTVRVFAATGWAGLHPKGVGRFLEVPFDPGGDDPASAGRRALVVGGLSVTPNVIAVQIEPEKERLLVHQLADAPPPGKGDRQWPI